MLIVVAIGPVVFLLSLVIQLILSGGVSLSVALFSGMISASFCTLLLLKRAHKAGTSA